MKTRMFKRIVITVLIAAMAVGMTACGKKTTSNQTPVSYESTVTESEKQETSVEETAKTETDNDGHDWPFIGDTYGKEHVVEVYTQCEDLTDWGSYAMFRTRDNYIYIKFPSLIPTGTNYVAYQSDDTSVFFSDASEGNFTDKITDVESIFKLAIEDKEDTCAPNKWLNPYFRVDMNSEITFTIDSTTLETVGQYDCCKYTGTASFEKEFSMEKKIYNYVAYSTFTNINNEPIYWIVFDESEDQSLGDTIAEYAKKMAYTIAENPYD